MNATLPSTRPIACLPRIADHGDQRISVNRMLAMIVMDCHGFLSPSRP
jgi:hypothetical protein